MRYNGFWYNEKERIVISRTTEDGIIYYRVVDDRGKKQGRLHKDYAQEKLPGYTKEGSNEMYTERLTV